jgi:hypothetical protein
MDSLKHTEERRGFPRRGLDLPLEYHVRDLPWAYGALTVNASERGLLMHSVVNLRVGTKLSILLLFPKEYELCHLAVPAQIVWKEIYWKADWEGFQYGLEFIELGDEDHLKLREVLKGQFEIGEEWEDHEPECANGKGHPVRCG